MQQSAGSTYVMPRYTRLTWLPFVNTCGQSFSPPRRGILQPSPNASRAMLLKTGCLISRGFLIHRLRIGLLRAFVAEDHAVDAEVAAGLEVVLVAQLVELVVAADQAVVPGRLGAEEVRSLGQVLLVVALLGRAGGAAEGGGRYAVAGGGVEEEGPFLQAAVLGAVGEAVAHAAELPFDEAVLH